MSTPRETAFTRAAKVELPLALGAMYPCGNPELVATSSYDISGNLDRVDFDDGADGSVERSWVHHYGCW